MFAYGKQRNLRSEVFKQYNFLVLPSDVFRLLIALRDWADDAGNVDLDMCEFSKRCPLMVPKPSPEQLDEWVGELVEAGFLHPYVVDGKRYASIDGFTDDSAPLYANKPHPKSASDWRNPSSNESEDEEVETVVPDNYGSHRLGRFTQGGNVGTEDVAESGSRPHRALRSLQGRTSRVHHKEGTKDVQNSQTPKRLKKVKKGTHDDTRSSKAGSLGGRQASPLPERTPSRPGRKRLSQSRTEGSSRPVRTRPVPGPSKPKVKPATRPLLTRKVAKVPEKPVERLNGSGLYPTKGKGLLKRKNGSKADPLFDVKAKLRKLGVEPLGTRREPIPQPLRYTDEDRIAMRLFGCTAEEYKRTHNSTIAS
jgi:hypothetical protein